MKILSIFLLISVLYACGSASNTEQNTDSNETSSNNDKSGEADSKKILKEFREFTWYRGTIGDTPVWMYFNNVGEKYCSAFYGYNSSKGAAIELRSGEKDGDNIKLNFEDYSSKYKEGFDLNFDSKTGTLSGEWSNSKNKKMPVKLESSNVIPRNTDELFELLPNAEKGFKADDYYNAVIANNQLFKEFFGTNFSQFIPNMGDFVNEYNNSPEDKSKLKASGKEGIIFAKKSLDKDHTLLLFSANFPEEKAISYNETYTIQSEKMLCAAIFDNSGKCKHAMRLGGYPEQGAAPYLDFSFELKADNKIILFWDEFFLGQGRHHVGQTVQTISVSPAGFKFEGSKSEQINEEN